jgi:hypothetical protein
LTLSYFVYYRVTQPQLAAIAVRGMQSELLANSGVSGRLLAKRDQPGLWMEVYEGVQDASAFEAELDRLIAAMKLDGFVEPGSRRHTECFEDSCA